MNIATRLQEEIQDKRITGSTVCDIYRGTQNLSEKEAFRKLGFIKTSLEYCKEVNEQQAHQIIVKTLSSHLSGCGLETMSKADAEIIASQFILALPGKPKLYTNEIWGGNEPLTHHCFDAGIIAIQEGVVGVLWVMDNYEP